MKELNRKVFKTIFILLSTFILIGILIYNINSYKNEYNNVKRNLTFIEDRNDFNKDNKPPEPKDKEIDNMMIMDYEVYTVKINNNQIESINKHTTNNTNFDIETISKKILSKNKGLNIGNLYNNKYSYNYDTNTIVIINTKSINKKLNILLIQSIILFLILEIIIFIISKELTKNITKPASDAFNKQKDFIADASHELKTPLSIIMASSDELKKDKKNKLYIDNISYETERMNKLIKSLLDLSKLEKGITKSTYKEENISKIIKRVALTFDSIAYENNIIIKTNIEDNILFNCNKEEIERLISIIIDNAIKHSYKNKTIIIDLSKNKNNITINISNEGDTIKEEDKERIFERFYRVDKSRNRDSNRYGLGLAIAKNIVINHNGTIKVNSKDNLTTFTITIKK